MLIVKPNAEIVKHDVNLYKFIEKIGRVCYKSEDKITEDSAKSFVTGLARSNHYAPIEHEYIYFQFEDIRDVIGFISQCIIPDNHSYNLTRYLNIANYFITGNVRAWIEFFDNIYNLSQKYEIGIGMYETMHWMLNTKYPDLFPLYSGWNYSEEEVDGDPIGVIGLIDRQAFIDAAKDFDGTDAILKTGLAHTVKFTCDRGCCYDDQTQVLTKDGWKYFKDVTMNDIFISLDDNENLVEVKPKRIIKKDYDGEMDYWNSTQINCMVTPNHNMWLYDYHKRSPKTKIWKFIQSSEAKNKRYLFNKSCTPLFPKGYDSFVIPSVIINRGFYKQTYPELRFDANLFFELIGWWITDGSVSTGKNGSGNRLCITQVKEKGVKRIKYLLEKLNIPYSKYSNDFRIKCPQLYKWIRDTFIKNNNNKKTSYISIPRWMMEELNEQNLKALMNGIIGGNGTRHTKGTGYVITVGSEKLAYDLVEIALRMGKAANLYRKKGIDRKFPNRDKTSKCNDSYNVSLINTTTTLFDTSKRTKEKYKGKIYCVELEQHHRLYVIRKGKACWCGNSHELVRHRAASFCQTSTRYCNYSQDKFNNEFSVIKPCFWNEADYEYELWREINIKNEGIYLAMTNNNVKPEEARSVLTNSLMTELFVTATEEEWQHILDLRWHGTTGKPHPQMKEVMDIAAPLLIKESEGRLS